MGLDPDSMVCDHLMMENDGWQRLHTIHEFIDGPRLGVADLHGVPHIYESVFDYALDSWSEEYRLSPIDPDLFAAVRENHAIFLRWVAAFHRGEVTLDTHPALPPDRPRHQDLKPLIGDKLQVDPASGKRLFAEFRSDKNGGTEVR